MKLPLLLLPLLLIGCGPAETPVAVQLTQSEMTRVPHSWQLDFKEKLKWDYATGVELQGMLAVYDHYHAPEGLMDYFLAYCDTMVTADGSIRTYKPQEESLDRINSVKLFFRAYEETGNKKYLCAIHKVFRQFTHQPRVAEGGFWHKRVYPQQMWLDGLYMGAPFYARYLSLYPDSVEALNTEVSRQAAEVNRLNANDGLSDSKPDDQPFIALSWDDIAKQFATVAAHTYDPVTGLYRHAWDAAHTQAWADPVSGQSAHAWGRAMGWFAMALVDALDYFPQSEAEGRDILLTILQTVCQGIASAQDPDSGLWHQVLDCPGREGNYLEASCSAMFVYALYKAIRAGYIPAADYQAIADKGYDAMLDRFIDTDAATGLVSLTQTCAVAGLGGNPYRAGDYDYYIHETIRANDPKGIGPFLLACVEHDMAH